MNESKTNTPSPQGGINSQSSKGITGITITSTIGQVKGQVPKMVNPPPPPPPKKI